MKQKTKIISWTAADIGAFALLAYIALTVGTQLLIPGLTEEYKIGMPTPSSL